MRVLQPEHPQLLMLEARLLIRSEEWLSAVRVLKPLEGQSLLDPSLMFALLAGGLFQLNDPDWCRYAADLLQNHGNSGSVLVLSRFLHHADRLPRVARERMFIAYLQAHVAERLAAI